MRNSDEYKKQAHNKLKKDDDSNKFNQDKITEAAMESFPASDPPAWTTGKDGK